LLNAAVMSSSHSDHASRVFLVEEVFHVVHKFLTLFQFFELLQNIELLRSEIVNFDSTSFCNSELKFLLNAEL
jgi:hypothetical protein